MIKSNLIDNNYYFPNKYNISSVREKIYFSRRKYLKTLIKTIHSKISNNSQSFFLSLFLMDIIFLNKNLEKQFFAHFPKKASLSSKDIDLNNYILLSLDCLILSYKFGGNKTLIYPIVNLMKIIHYVTEEKFGFNQNDLIIGEACVIKILKYKLNFYTVYHYLVFFFHSWNYFQKNIKKKSRKKNIRKNIYRIKRNA